ncbi:MAG: hypothetical protein M1831_006454 [Alyxoria varia]|nr:MAG: hypothetical protein M1831_006454 [Alyxoria varia]
MFAGPSQPPGATANRSGKQEGPPIEEVTTEAVSFSALGDLKLRVLHSPWPTDNLPSKTGSLFSVASQAGIFAAAGPDALVIGKTDAARESMLTKAGSQDDGVKIFNPDITLQVPRLSQVYFSSDEKYLVICAETGGGLAVYDVQLLSQGNREPAFQISTEGIGIQSLIPNPLAASGHVFAIVLEDGKLMIADLQDRAFKNGPQGPVLKTEVSCASWSAKGKQLTAGLRDGTAVQMKPEGATVSSIPTPPQIGQVKSHVSSLLWLSNDAWLIFYNLIDGDANDPKVFLVTRAPNTQLYGFEQFSNPPLYLESQRGGAAHHYISRLRKYEPHFEDILFIASSESSDINIVACSSIPLSSDPVGQAATNKYTLVTMSDDSKRAAIPVSSLRPVSLGLAMDLSTKEKVKRPIPSEEALEQSPNPLPAIMSLSPDGWISAWYFVYKDAILQAKPFHGLVGAGAAQPNAAPSNPQNGSANALAGNQTTVAKTPAFGSGGGFMGSALPGASQSVWSSAQSGSAARTGGASFGQSGFTAAKPMAAPQTGPSTLVQNAPVFGQGASSKPAQGPAFGNTTASPFAAAAGNQSASPWASASSTKPAENSLFSQTASSQGGLFGTSNNDQSAFGKVGEQQVGFGWGQKPKPATGPGLPAQDSVGSTMTIGSSLDQPSGVENGQSAFGTPSLSNKTSDQSANQPQTNLKPQDEDTSMDQADNVFGKGIGRLQLGNEDTAQKQEPPVQEEAPLPPDPQTDKSRDAQPAASPASPRPSSKELEVGNMDSSLPEPAPGRSQTQTDQARDVQPAAPRESSQDAAQKKEQPIEEEAPAQNQTPEKHQLESTLPTPSSMFPSGGLLQNRKATNPPINFKPPAYTQKSPSPVRGERRRSQSPSKRNLQGTTPLAPSPAGAPVQPAASRMSSSSNITAVQQQQQQQSQQKAEAPKMRVNETLVWEGFPSEEDRDHINAQTELNEPVEPTKSIGNLIPKKPEASTGANLGVGTHMELLARSIDAMIDDTGRNARTIEAFIKYHSGYLHDGGREREHLSDDHEWSLGETEDLGALLRELNSRLESGRLENKAQKIRDLQSLFTELQRLRTRGKVQIERDIDRLTARDEASSVSSPSARSARLTNQQSTMLHDLRADFARVRQLIVKAEDAASLLRAKLAASSSRGGQGSPAGVRNHMPTLENTLNTVTKMSRMTERKRDEVDMVAAQLRRVERANKTASGLRNSITSNGEDFGLSQLSLGDSTRSMAGPPGHLARRSIAGGEDLHGSLARLSLGGGGAARQQRGRESHSPAAFATPPRKPNTRPQQSQRFDPRAFGKNSYDMISADATPSKQPSTPKNAGTSGKSATSPSPFSATSRRGDITPAMFGKKTMSWTSPTPQPQAPQQTNGAAAASPSPPKPNTSAKLASPDPAHASATSSPGTIRVPVSDSDSEEEEESDLEFHSPTPAPGTSVVESRKMVPQEQQFVRSSPSFTSVPMAMREGAEIAMLRGKDRQRHMSARAKLVERVADEDVDRVVRERERRRVVGGLVREALGRRKERLLLEDGDGGGGGGEGGADKGVET